MDQAGDLQPADAVFGRMNDMARMSEQSFQQQRRVPAIVNDHHAEASARGGFRHHSPNNLNVNCAEIAYCKLASAEQ
jgi:hypothetical protein